MTIRNISMTALLVIPLTLKGQNYPPPPADVGSVVRLASGDEPGVPLIITGTVYREDKTTPVAGALLYLYHVDARGEYGRNARTRIARLNGWVKTDRDGRYEIRTIRPSSYPNSRVAAHIHSFILHPDGSREWIQDFLFADDPHLSAKAKRTSERDGGFSHILHTESGDDGILRAVRNIVIQRKR